MLEQWLLTQTQRGGSSTGTGFWYPNFHIGTAAHMARPTARIPLPVMRRVGSNGSVRRNATRQSTYPTAEITVKANQVQIPKKALIFGNSPQRQLSLADTLYTAQGQLSQQNRGFA